MAEELRVDPEFEGKIPPLTEAEYKQLEENILDAGEVYEPIVVWNGTIVDGHNRYKIVSQHPEVVWRTREVSFRDKWAAFDWMYKNQLGRRNLTEAQRTYLLGKLYEARKHTHGAEPGGRGNQYTNVVSPQNAGIPNGRIPRVAEILGQELGVNHSTVERADGFAHGIDAIRADSPDTADAILTGKLTPKKADVIAIGKADVESRGGMIRSVQAGQRVAKPEAGTAARPIRPAVPPMDDEQYDRITRSIESMGSAEDVTSYSVSDLINEISWNAIGYMSTIRGIIEQHMDVVTDENRWKVEEALDNYITEVIESIKEEMKNGTHRE